jgi:hypothetical protein
VQISGSFESKSRQIDKICLRTVHGTLIYISDNVDKRQDSKEVTTFTLVSALITRFAIAIQLFPHQYCIFNYLEGGLTKPGT